MKSAAGIAGALAILLGLPLAVVANTLTGVEPEPVLHFVIGTGFVLFAISVFAFDLPRWLNWVGALSAAAFGGIFLLQGVSDIVNSEALAGIAFGPLGHEIERVLPDVIFLWFVGLLLGASHGKTRIVGWIVMPIVVAIEVAALAAVVLGIGFPTIKILFLLPFVWYLIEAIKLRMSERTASQPRGRELAETSAA
jgi:hypothetical protein